MIELEYLPCVRAGAGTALLHELLEDLLEPPEDGGAAHPAGGAGAAGATFRTTSAPAGAADGADAPFGRGHAAMQWVEMLRAAHGVGLSEELADVAVYAPPPLPVT